MMIVRSLLQVVRQEVVGADWAVDRRARGRREGEDEAAEGMGWLVGEAAGWVAVGWEAD
jgi:hypothetical protein